MRRTLAFLTLIDAPAGTYFCWNFAKLKTRLNKPEQYAEEFKDEQYGRSVAMPHFSWCCELRELSSAISCTRKHFVLSLKKGSEAVLGSRFRIGLPICGR